MKLKFTLIIMMIIIAQPVYGFSKYGKISKELSFEDIEVYQPSIYSLKVKGKLKNETDYKISISADLVFHRTTGTIINTASIYERIPARGTVFFDDYLKSDNYKTTREALHLSWMVNNLNIDKPKKDKKISKTKKKKDVPESSSIVREGRSTIYINGYGEQNTDKFTCESGKHIIKAEHQGDRNFIVHLRDQFGDVDNYLINEIGDYSNSLTFLIEKKNEYFLDVDADGKWSFEIERPKRLLDNTGIAKTVKSDSVSSQKIKYKIELKDGRVMKVDSYKEQGSKIILRMYGAEIFINEQKIKSIEKLNIE